MCCWLGHSTLAFIIGWTKLFLLLGSAFLPPCWPLLAVYIYYKWTNYKASYEHLSPKWLERGVPLNRRIQNAVDSSAPNKKEGFFDSRDGLKLKYFTLGHGSKHILICNGVNCSWFLWVPIFKSMQESLGKDWQDEFTVVTWEYRGLYGSELPKTTASVSVRSLAEDGYDLMQHLKLAKWHAVFGWSTGVQVSLEFAGLYPSCVERVFLINGSHGHCLRFAFSTLGVPGLSSIMSHVLQLAFFVIRFSVCAYPARFARMSRLWMKVQEVLGPTLLRYKAFMLGRADFEFTAATNVVDFFNHGPEHLDNVCRIFQALDCHSVAYFLPELKVPILVVAGLQDDLTPAFTQYEIAALAQRVRLVPFLTGSHHCVLEFPQQAGKELSDFLLAGKECLETWGAKENIAPATCWGLF